MKIHKLLGYRESGKINWCLDKIKEHNDGEKDILVIGSNVLKERLLSIYKPVTTLYNGNMILFDNIIFVSNLDQPGVIGMKFDVVIVDEISEGYDYNIDSLYDLDRNGNLKVYVTETTPEDTEIEILEKPIPKLFYLKLKFADFMETENVYINKRGNKYYFGDDWQYGIHQTKFALEEINNIPKEITDACEAVLVEE